MDFVANELCMTNENVIEDADPYEDVELEESKPISLSECVHYMNEVSYCWMYAIKSHKKHFWLQNMPSGAQPRNNETPQ